MTAIVIEVTDQPAIAALDRLGARIGDPDPALKAIGEALLVQVKRTFETGTDPWGRRWLPNTQATIMTYLRRQSRGKQGYFRKDGRLAAKGVATVTGKRPLIGLSHFLSGASLSYDVSNHAVTLGSSAIYAAMQQWGGTKAQFVNLWGDIPPRHFLPITRAGDLSPEAQGIIAEIIGEYLDLSV